MRREADARHREPAQRGVAVDRDAAAGTSAPPVRETGRVAAQGSSSEGKREEHGWDPGALEGGGMDVEAHVEAALARIMAPASPPTVQAVEEDSKGQERSGRVEEAGEEDEGLEVTGAREAHELERGETGVADKAEPKTGELETYRHWAKGWSMHANACRFAHPQPPVPQGVTRYLLILQPYCPRGSPQPPSFRPTREAAARRGGEGAGCRAPNGMVRGGAWEQDRVGDGATLRCGGLAHHVSGGPMEGHGAHPGGVPGVGVHVAHASRRYGPAEVAVSCSRDLPLLVAAHSDRYLDAMVGQGAELGPRW